MEKQWRVPATALGNRARADYARAQFHVVLDPGVTVEQLLTPRTWAMHGGANSPLKPGDLIDVITADFSLDCTFRVRGVEVGMVHLIPLRVWQKDRPAEKPKAPDAPMPDVPEGYKVHFAPRTRWRVMTVDPQETVSQGHKGELEARQAAIQHAARAKGEAA